MEPEFDSSDPAATRWNDVIHRRLEQLRAGNLLRTRRVVRPLDSVHVQIDGRALINFSSNDYLGLAQHPSVITAAVSAAASGFGTGAAPLISGYTPIHQSAERKIAQWKKTESAVLFPSGYQANLAAIQTIAVIRESETGVRFLVDKLVHASLIDAVRASGRPFRIFPHNNIEKLRRLLTESEPRQLQVVVTESIFSMDGDAANLQGIVDLKLEFEFLLVLDEAHGSGVYGPSGAGLAAELGLDQHIDLYVVTLSKALGCTGAAVCGSETLCNAVINLGRAYLFSTSVPGCVGAAAEAAINVLAREPERQKRVRDNSIRVRRALSARGVTLKDGDSPIIPLILGSEERALSAAEQLLREGLLVVAVRPPTVPRGSSRLRVTLSSEHTDEHLNRLLDSVGRVVQ